MATRGFFNIVTDGTYFYTSSSNQRSICKIDKKGVVDVKFIKFVNERPFSLVVVGKYLYVYLKKDKERNLGHIWKYDLEDDKEKTLGINWKYDIKEDLLGAIPVLMTSWVYPVFIYEKTGSNEEYLYLSDYDSGNILRINLKDMYQKAYLTEISGISGMCFVFGNLYISSESYNQIYYIIDTEWERVDSNKTGIVPLLSDPPIIYIDSPKGIQYKDGNLHICYGVSLYKSTAASKDSGVAIYSLSTKERLSVINYYQYDLLPLNILITDAMYVTMIHSTDIYRDRIDFAFAKFTVPQTYNGVGVTESVILKEIACLNDPAYDSLLKLRTYGIDPANPRKPITDRIGRSSGIQIDFSVLGNSYEELCMRRKAEILQHKKNGSGVTPSKKQQFKNTVDRTGEYQFSQKDIDILLEERNNCQIGYKSSGYTSLVSPSASGVIDTKFQGYYLNPYITFYPSL
jgi:hypothetical protein